MPDNRHDATALHARVEHDFTLHPPESNEAAERMNELRREAKTFAHLIIDLCPTGRELSSALTKLEESLFHAIASIARHQHALDR